MHYLRPVSLVCVSALFAAVLVFLFTALLVSTITRADRTNHEHDKHARVKQNSTRHIVMSLSQDAGAIHDGLDLEADLGRVIDEHMGLLDQDDHSGLEDFSGADDEAVAAHDVKRSIAALSDDDFQKRFNEAGPFALSYVMCLLTGSRRMISV